MTIGTMEVHLVSARGLKNTDLLGNIDPYVLVQYKGQERKSNIARGQGNNPVWDEKLTFRAEYPGGDGEYKLVLKIMDHDNFSSDDYLGEAVIYLKDLLQLGVENGTAEIHPSKYSIVAGDLSFSGEIKVGLTFTPKEGQSEREEEIGGWKESGY